MYLPSGRGCVHKDSCYGVLKSTNAQNYNVCETIISAQDPTIADSSALSYCVEVPKHVGEGTPL
jgi:hypothetical protein